MTTLTFDKLAYVDRLTAAGFSEQQARAMADSLDTALREEVATKTDLAPLATLDAVRDLASRVGRVEWMVGTNITLTLIVLGKLVLLP
jgi:hypothetical protein